MDFQFVVKLFSIGLLFYGPARLFQMWFEHRGYPAINRFKKSKMPVKYYTQTISIVVTGIFAYVLSDSISIIAIVIGLILVNTALLIMLFIRVQTFFLANDKNRSITHKDQQLDLQNNYQYIKGLY